VAKRASVSVTTPDSVPAKDEEVSTACPGGHDIVGVKSKKGLAYVFNCLQHRYRAIVPLSSPLFK
jgi:hypothetical protein